MDGSEFMNMTKRETIAAMAMQAGYHCEPGRFRQNGDFLNQENHQWIEQNAASRIMQIMEDEIEK
jgi:hypothetical protein